MVLFVPFTKHVASCRFPRTEYPPFEPQWNYSHAWQSISDDDVP